MLRIVILSRSSCSSCPATSVGDAGHVWLIAAEVVDAHGVSDDADGLPGLAAGAAAALNDDLLDQAGLRLEVGAALADRGQEVFEGGDQLALDLDIADLSEG